MLLKNCRITIRKVADDVDISVGIQFFECFGHKKRIGGVISKLLDRNNRLIVQVLINNGNDNPDLPNRVITGDKT